MDNNGEMCILSNITTPTAFFFSFASILFDSQTVSDETNRGIFVVLVRWLNQPSRSQQEWISLNALLVKGINQFDVSYLVSLGLDLSRFFQDLLRIIGEGGEIVDACNMINILSYKDDAENLGTFLSF